MANLRQLHWFLSHHQKVGLSSRKKTRGCPGLIPAASPGLYVTGTSPWGRTHAAGGELSWSHWKSHTIDKGSEGKHILKVPLLMAEEIWAGCSTNMRVRVEGACLLPLWKMGAMNSLVLSAFDASTLHNIHCVCTTPRLSERGEPMTNFEMSAKNWGWFFSFF